MLRGACVSVRRCVRAWVSKWPDSTLMRGVAWAWPSGVEWGLANLTRTASFVKFEFSRPHTHPHTHLRRCQGSDGWCYELEKYSYPSDATDTCNTFQVRWGGALAMTAIASNMAAITSGKSRR